MRSPPVTLQLYRRATQLLAPAAPALLRRRATLGKEDPSRLRERLGFASLPRPDGQLVWIHGASVGECVAVLPLIEKLLQAPTCSVLLTSGTVTSARLMRDRLPACAIHQYSTVDIPGAVARFLDHWRPDIALFVDSEIWPNTLAGIHGRGIPLALINGRMSKSSFIGWQRLPRTASAVFSYYDACLAQDNESAERFRSLGAHNVSVSGNLKADAPPLPADAQKLQELTAVIGGRPVLLAASTHPGEEEFLLSAHDALQRQCANLLTIVAPRHPDRGRSIASLCGSRPVSLRSAGCRPGPETAVYVADTLGELGLLFRVASFAFMGGSLVAHGGQNPLEPARLARAVIAGPHTNNFAQAYEAVLARQGEGRVHTATDIAAFATRMFANPAEAARLGQAALAAADSLGGALGKTRCAVEAMLANHARA